MSDPTFVSGQHIQAFEPALPKALLALDRMGLSLAQAFEPGRFSAKQTNLAAGWFLFLRAADGWCWALVRAVDADGRLVLEREQPASIPLVDTTRTRRTAA